MVEMEVGETDVEQARIALGQPLAELANSGAGIEGWAPQHLAGCIVEEDEVPPRIRDERRRCELRREGTGDDQDQVRLFAFHAPDPTQLLVRLGFAAVAKVAPEEHELRRVLDEER